MRCARYFLIAALAVWAVPAFAGTACYTPRQMKAEQWLRLHSELMVITVTCRQGSNGQSLPAAYGYFTRKYIRALHAAEQTLIAYYRTTAKGDAVEHLDGLRTLLGNEAGQIAADMSPPKFCALYRDRVAQFDAATSADIDNHIRRMELFVRSYARPCGKTAGTKKKG